MKKSELLMDVFCVFFLLSSLFRLSFASVVFDFNASLNDVAPVSPMLLPVVVKRKEWFVNGRLLCVFCFYISY